MARPRMVVVGAGFAGFHAARTLSRLARGAAEVVLVNPTDYVLYVPVLPEVIAGILDPRRTSPAATPQPCRTPPGRTRPRRRGPVRSAAVPLDTASPELPRSPVRPR